MLFIVSVKMKEARMLDASTFAYRTEAPVELAVLSERVQDGARI